jgi:glycine cleavage system aminomethyltransferase T
LSGLNEQSKIGDDYAARIYVVVKGGLAFWQTRAINYVWAGNTKKDSVWPNAFAGDHAMMLALRGPEAPLNVWQTEKRDIRADFKRLLGQNIQSIDAVAIMTDTDNSGDQVSAAYGDIWFSKD